MEKKSEEELERIANQVTAEMNRDLNAAKTDEKGKKPEPSSPEEEMEEG